MGTVLEKVRLAAFRLRVHLVPPRHRLLLPGERARARGIFLRLGM